MSQDREELGHSRSCSPLPSPGALGDFLPAKRSEGCCEISEPPTSLQARSAQAFLERWNEAVGRFGSRQGNVREARVISPPPRFGSLTPSFPWMTSPLLLTCVGIRALRKAFPLPSLATNAEVALDGFRETPRGILRLYVTWLDKDEAERTVQICAFVKICTYTNI